MLSLTSLFLLPAAERYALLKNASILVSRRFVAWKEEGWNDILVAMIYSAVSVAFLISVLFLVVLRNVLDLAYCLLLVEGRLFFLCL